jgi:hypothetical protein
MIHYYKIYNLNLKMTSELLTAARERIKITREKLLNDMSSTQMNLESFINNKKKVNR